MEIVPKKEMDTAGRLWKEIADALIALKPEESLKLYESEILEEEYAHIQAFRAVLHAQFPRRFETKIQQGDENIMYISLRRS